MMKTIAYLLLLVICGTTALQAQDVPATVVLKDGRTLTGFVKSLKGGYNPQELILYPQKEDKNPQPVPAESISEVTIEGEGTFIVASVKKYTNELDFNKISRIPDFENKEVYVVQVLFLKRLHKGEKLNLYTYKDASRNHYFIQKPGGEIETLRYVRSLDPVTKSSVREYRYYQQQLLPYVSGNRKLENRLEAVGWNDNSMIRFCKEINANTAAYAIYEGRSSEKSVLFLGAGANMSSFSATAKNDFQGFFENMSFSNSILPVLSIGSELSFNSRNTNGGFRFQFALSAFAFNTTGKSNWNDNGIQRTGAINAKGINISFGPAVKYQFGKSFSIGTGANLNVTAFSELRGATLPQFVTADGVFGAFGGSKAGAPFTLTPFIQSQFMITPKHGVQILFSPQQRNVKFYEGANLRMGYASLSYIFKIASGND